MSTNNNNNINGTQNWKTPDELMRLQIIQRKSKRLLASREQINSSNISTIQKDNCGSVSIEVQKRKNPFSKQFEDDSKKIKISDAKDSIIANGGNNAKDKEALLKEIPLNSLSTPLTLHLHNANINTNALMTILKENSPCAVTEEAVVEEQNITKYLPMDWSIKKRVRFFCRSELPSVHLKTGQLASGLTSFVRCLNNQSQCGFDVSLATRFNQATYYWQHPYIPWMTLFPRNSRDNSGVTLGERERKALAEDWDHSFRGLFHLLRARQCAYFYLCADSFIVLFRAAGIAGFKEIHALVTPTTCGIRHALRQEGIEYSMPLKINDTDIDVSEEHAFDVNERTTCIENNSTSGSHMTDKSVQYVEEQGEEWLETLGVDENEIRKIKNSSQRKLKAHEISEDAGDNSLIFIEGVECQGFFSFLLNAKSTISSIGRLAGVPPTLLAPVAFPKATIQNLSTKSSKVRMDSVDYFSIEIKGTILPTFLPYTCHLFSESKDAFSSTLASNDATFAFSKASKKLFERATTKDIEITKESNSTTSSEIFDNANLSDCGLQYPVIENMCRVTHNALLERVCYDKDFGYAWS